MKAHFVSRPNKAVGGHCDDDEEEQQLHIWPTLSEVKRKKEQKE